MSTTAKVTSDGLSMDEALDTLRHAHDVIPHSDETAYNIAVFMRTVRARRSIADFADHLGVPSEYVIRAERGTIALTIVQFGLLASRAGVSSKNGELIDKGGVSIADVVGPLAFPSPLGRELQISDALRVRINDKLDELDHHFAREAREDV